MKLQEFNPFKLLAKREARLIANLPLATSKWKVLYKRSYFWGTALSVFAHLFLILWVFYFSEKKSEVNTVKINTFYEKVPPPIKYEPTPPKLAKDFDLVKEQSTTTEYEPKDYTMDEAANTEDLRSDDIRPNMTSTNPVGGQGSVFHGALTSNESGGAEGWSIPGGTRSYGTSTGRGGSGGLFGKDDGSMGFGPDIEYDVSNTRTSGRQTDRVSDDLLDYSNFRDRYEGYVKVGKNKKDIIGHLNLYTLQYRGSRLDENGEPGYNVVPQALPNLASFAEKHTRLDFSLKGTIRLDDKLIMEVPIVYMTGSESSPVYTQVEVKALEKYLRNGGFLFIDDGYAARWASFNKKSRQLVEEALGYDAEWEKIPNDHWIYRCWEDFNGPPSGEDNIRPNPNHPVKERYNYLEGIFINGRLVVLLSSKGYGKAWGAWPTNPTNLGGPIDNTRQLQFGLNVVVFACTQKGGIIDRQNQKEAAQK